MMNGYVHAAIDYQWLGLDRLACIVSGSVPVGYAAKYSSIKIDIAARLTHPTNRLISGQLRLSEAEVPLTEVV
ncbi:hypothetical protein R6242_09165 [Iodobacter sp. CM08]|uniref:hypothetical protein n=1 Tax=Iodobacter sp. CM08 TaxID=3085902 RepID=UPI0029817101|nr:hypothetical protein [Iodobacter sp. CM08]MDW5416739.1 hypothetical protein [Iodobacter sp. CM08]